MKKHVQNYIAYLPVLLIIAVVSAGIGYAGYIYQQMVMEIESVKHLLADTEAARTALEEKNFKLENIILQAQNDNTNLLGSLSDERSKNDLFEKQLQAIGSTVQTLDILSKTDKELLQKYSKVYFLNENYIPSDLTVIIPSYTLDQSKLLQFHTKAYPFLRSMLDAASSTGAQILAVSAYRSFGEQSSLKSSYKITYGAGANRFSADQGYSEHQLGTAVDLTSKTLGGLSLSFDATPQGKWLAENAYKYGFIISYPKQNIYYQYEPWHWRFVGVDLATKIHGNNQYFYELPEREIDSYLVSIFN